MPKKATDPRFVVDERFTGEAEAESSTSQARRSTSPGGVERDGEEDAASDVNEERSEGGEDEEGEGKEGLGEGMLAQGFSGPSEKVVKPLTPEDLAKFKAAQEKTGVVYISRIPPGMRPTKVRHLMSGYGVVGRVYLQPEDAKRAYLRRKYTSTKKIHFTEGWVEFKDKRVARSVAEMLNAQPIGGKKGSRWRDDVWTMKYLPKFKWNMLTEQIAHEAAMHTARLRVELSQSKREQQEYLKNVELARVLDKRAERKRKAGEEVVAPEPIKKHRADKEGRPPREKESKPRKVPNAGRDDKQLSSVLSSVF
ncbi:hypothetical protein BDW22DRAFT_1351858 [Trametopsis cervina]|nr:hypothetical protein BDW22DRAFT_1351858 [Trametopsis cervina]